VTGYSVGESSNDDYVTIKYSQSSSGIIQKPLTIPRAYTLEQNYPNPFNASTTINYSLLRTGEVRLSVCNLSGGLITALVEGRQEAGQHQVTFPGSNLPSGIYLYRLQAEDFTASGKMVLLK
jgi:hypothetical protein